MSAPSGKSPSTIFDVLERGEMCETGEQQETVVRIGGVPMHVAHYVGDPSSGVAILLAGPREMSAAEAALRHLHALAALVVMTTDWSTGANPCAISKVVEDQFHSLLHEHHRAHTTYLATRGKPS